MDNPIPKWQLGGFVFTAILGTLLHFLFDWTGGSAVAALFSAVNESIWEHMKLLYYPMLLFALWEYRVWGRKTPGFWQTKLAGFLLGLGLIPVVYYTYTGIGGVNADWFNVTIFFIAAAAAFWTETKLFQREFFRGSGKAALGLILLISLVFTLLTFYPPRIPFFRDPVTGTYGFGEKV